MFRRKSVANKFSNDPKASSFGTFTLNFDDNKQVYFPPETITGVLSCRANTDVAFGGLHVSIQCEIFFDDSGKTVIPKGTLSYEDAAVLSENETLEADKSYNLPFSLMLPSNCPSSLKLDGALSYEAVWCAVGWMVLDGSPIELAFRNFHFGKRILHSNKPPVPVATSFSSFMSRAAVHAEASLASNVFNQTKPMKISLSVGNSPGKDIKIVTASLFQTVRLDTTTPCTWRKVVGTQEFPPVGSNTDNKLNMVIEYYPKVMEKDVLLQIFKPTEHVTDGVNLLGQLVPSTAFLLNGDKVEIRYSVRVQIVLRGGKTGPKLDLPVRVSDRYTEADIPMMETAMVLATVPRPATSSRKPFYRQQSSDTENKSKSKTKRSSSSELTSRHSQSVDDLFPLAAPSSLKVKNRKEFKRSTSLAQG